MAGGMNYTEYYLEQAGGKMEPYTTYRFLPSQKGSGFFGRLIKGTIWPFIKQILPYAKNKALSGVGDLVSGLQEGKSLKEAGKSALKRTAGDMFSDATREISSQFQKGSGIRRRKRKSNKTANTRRKTKRRVVKARKTGKATRKTRKGKRPARSVLFP